MSAAVRTCGLIPTYDNPATVGAVARALRAHLPEVIVVDDGSGPAGRAACDALGAEGVAHVERHVRNAGKGAAVKTGLAAARARGCTHALQVDGDGQHDLAAVPAFLEAGAAHPDALVLGYPVYDASAPGGRRLARRITAFWVALELGGRDRVRDAMVGFRLYPVQAALDARARGDRMDFDIEIAVRMARGGVPVINLPVRVRYLSREEGGVSHFSMLGDNLRFFALHARLCTGGALAFLLGRRAGGPR